MWSEVYYALNIQGASCDEWSFLSEHVLVWNRGCLYTNVSSYALARHQAVCRYRGSGNSLQLSKKSVAAQKIQFENTIEALHWLPAQLPLTIFDGDAIVCPKYDYKCEEVPDFVASVAKCQLYLLLSLCSSRAETLALNFDNICLTSSRLENAVVVLQTAINLQT